MTDLIDDDYEPIQVPVLGTSWEVDCLAYDPFNEDCDIKTFSDKFLVGRKAHRCQDCDGEIPVGERHRAMTQAFEGQVDTFRFCRLCCEAQALSWQDDGNAIEARITIGHQRRAAARAAARETDR